MSGPSVPTELAPRALEIPQAEIEQKLDDVELIPLENHLNSIVNSAQVKFRKNFEEEVPEEVPALVSGDSDSDEEPPSPRRPEMEANIKSVASGMKAERETVIGGAVVKNLSLVIPNQDFTGWGNLPVLPITATGQEKSQLLAAVPDDQSNEQDRHIPLLLLPDEDEVSPTAAGQEGVNLSRMAAASALSALNPKARTGLAEVSARKASKEKDGEAEAGQPAEQKVKDGKDGKEGTGKVAKIELESYVLSGDIKNFFGIKGLKAKLYKFKGPEAKDDKGTGSKGDGQPKPDNKAEGEIVPKANKDTSVIKKGKTEEGKGGKDGEGEKGEKGEKKEPAREKVKIDPKSLALLGKPLGKLLPFLESEEIKSIPVENLEFTYCEEKNSNFFPPGLRLEVDVLLKNSLQWATDGLHKILGDQRTPKKVHLSAYLGEKRDWTKRPKVNDFALRGYFDDFGAQDWDILKLKTLGLEITATKAASKKPKDQKKPKDDKDKDPDADKGAAEKDTDKPSSHETDEQVIEEPDNVPTIKKEPASQPEKRDASAGKGEKGPTADTAKRDGEKGSSEGDKKDGEKKSYNYGFGFFGTVSLLKVPHANSPLDLDIRIARDFVVEKKDKDGGKEDSKGKGDTDVKGEGDGGKGSKAEGESEGDKKIKAADKQEAGEDSKETTEESGQLAKTPAATTDREANAGAQDASGKPEKKEDKPKPPADKTHSDGKHKRVWNVVVSCDEWKDIWGVKNVTMKKAELKWSFEQGEFKKTMAFDLSANVKLGRGTFKVKGKISKDEQSLGAEVGDLSLTDLKKIHAQIQGHKVPEEKKTDGNSEKEKKEKEEEKKDEEKEAKGNDITFKKLRLDLSRKLAKKQKTYKTSLTLEGHVKFNETASSRALLEINTDGLTISGGLSEFKIPETCVTIQQAQMLIFIGFKHEKKVNKGDGKNENQSDSKDGNSDGKQLGNASKPEAIKPSESTEQDGQADEAPTSVVKTNKEVKKTEDGNQKQKRLSEFAILGIVKVEELTVSVGFYTARNKGKMKRDWVAFGSIAGLTMQKIVGEQVKGNFLDLRLDNLALIASSDDRDKKEQEKGEKDPKTKDSDKKEEQSEKTGDKLLKDTEKAVEKIGKSTQDSSKTKDGGSKDKAGEKDSSGKDKPKKDGDDEELAHAGVLKTVESYNYPIKKGVQLCATIRRFEQLEQLNNNRKIDGLILIIALTPEGLEISVDLPKTLQVFLRDDIILGDFGASIILSELKLRLSATLTLTFDDQKPIRVHGDIYGAADSCGGNLYMDKNDRWINPFKLNEKVTVSKLGVGTGFNYAMVINHLNVAGRLDVGKEFHAQITLSVGLKTGQVILFDVSEINISKLVRLAGEMTDIMALQDVNGGQDFLVFHDVKFSLSTGTVVFGVRYEEGIHIRGRMELFGTKGEIDGQFCEDGLFIKGGIDPINIGGLEVRSAKTAGDRATMEVEMTDDKQKVFVDGMIRFHAYELNVFLNAHVQKRTLEADISVQFTEHIAFMLKANASVPDSNSLEKAVMDFRAEIHPDMVAALFDAIQEAISTIRTLALDSIDTAVNNLQCVVNKKEAELKQTEADLKVLEGEVNEEIQKRQTKIKEDNEEREKLENELQRLKNAVTEARQKHDQNKTAITNLEDKEIEIKRRYDTKIRETNNHYKQLEEQEKDNQRKWKGQLKELEDKKERSYGPKLRDLLNAQLDYKSWDEDIQNQQWWVKECERRLQNAGIFEKPLRYAELSWAETKLEGLQVSKSTAFVLLIAAQTFLNSPEYKSLMKSLDDIGDQLEKSYNFLNSTLEGDHAGAVNALLQDKKRELEQQAEMLNDLINTSITLEDKLTLAREALKNNKGHITDEETNLQVEINRLQGELKTKPFEHTYNNKRQEYENVKIVIGNIQKQLGDIRKGIDEATKVASENLNVLKQGIPSIERIVITASTEVLSNNKPLTFLVEARWKGKSVCADLQWAPGWSISKFYEDAGKKVIQKAGEQA